MKKFIFFTVLLGIVIGLLILAWPFSQHNSEQTTAHLILNDKPVGGDFTLQSAEGPVSLSDFNDKLVLAYFGYTFCPDICPTNLGNLAVAYRQLMDEEKAKLQILFISVDPKRDTPERLKQYADYFDSGIIGLTGTKTELDEIANRYGVVYMIHQDDPKDEHYSVDHSAFTYVIPPGGELATQLPHATSPDDFVKTIRTYLNQPQP
ncbi:electron transporter SenC [Thiomicrospira sp. XS5]|uniref:SCO family protein n=1 Tax=Thiomicrospira sp. XS5 TaxID=1775636 RepID=UPI000749F066|nr:SCO family protein [Thiomicrospira sp. XS5]KUJ75786.1 electron transporter SenC [Thiomicrospira sp. XS5]